MEREILQERSETVDRISEHAHRQQAASRLEDIHPAPLMPRTGKREHEGMAGVSTRPRPTVDIYLRLLGFFLRRK